MPASADPVSIPALDLCPRLCPLHPSSSAILSDPETPLMGENQSLAPSAQQTLAGWRAFVTSGDPEVLAPLLADHVVFRSPFVQSPIPGRTATVLVLTTVAQIFENF